MVEHNVDILQIFELVLLFHSRDTELAESFVCITLSALLKELFDSLIFAFALRKRHVLDLFSLENSFQR